jgi:anti-sigma factor RsiW
LLASHLTDVTTSDEHTVKPWFNGKLDASPPVVDLAPQAFLLIGGRLDYVHNRVRGVLVFKHDQHVINLFVWPVADLKDSGPTSTTREGFNLLHWTCSGMSFWAVSDVNPAHCAASRPIMIGNQRQLAILTSGATRRFAARRTREA